MPYVERIVEAGPIRETLKTFTGRVHTQGATREENRGPTSEAQAKVNERVAEERLRWKLNANFTPGDYHLVLHYYDKGVTLEPSRRGQEGIPAAAAEGVPEAGVAWKYVCMHRDKRMTNVHHTSSCRP